MDPSKIRRAHDLALKEAGLRHIRIHDLRGTYTSLAVSAGVPIYYSRNLSVIPTQRQPSEIMPPSPPERREKRRT